MIRVVVVLEMAALLALGWLLTRGVVGAAQDCGAALRAFRQAAGWE